MVHFAGCCTWWLVSEVTLITWTLKTFRLVVRFPLFATWHTHRSWCVEKIDELKAQVYEQIRLYRHFCDPPAWKHWDAQMTQDLPRQIYCCTTSVESIFLSSNTHHVGEDSSQSSRSIYSYGWCHSWHVQWPMLKHNSSFRLAKTNLDPSDSWLDISSNG